MSLTYKKYIKAKDKFVEKNIEYFSIFDENGSGLYFHVNADVEVILNENSSGEFRNLIIYLKNFKRSECFFKIFKIYRTGSMLGKCDFSFKGNCAGITLASVKMKFKIKKLMDETGGFYEG